MAEKKGARVWTIRDMIALRKKRWEHGYPEKGIEPHDIAYDQEVVVNAAVTAILGDAHTEPNADLVSDLREKPHLLIELAFTVVDKNKRTVPFFLNEVQADFVEKLQKYGTLKPFLVLKGRQQGFTTVITAIQLATAIVLKNFSGLTLADCAENVGAIFNDKARSMHGRIHPRLKPREKYNSKRELYFDKLGSSWRTAVATSDVGRSKTLSFVHLSEAAFFQCALSDIQAGLLQACTAEATVIYESTANGFNAFKDLWDSGTCVNLFYEWWRTAEYRSKDHALLEEAERGEADGWLCERIEWLRDEQGLDRDQLAWYANKYASYLDKAMIRQEYPCSPDEAFISSGTCVFDAEALTHQLMRVYKNTYECGEFTYRRVKEEIRDSHGDVVDEEWKLADVQWVAKPNGIIRIHEKPKVLTDKKGNVTHRAPYVLGGDTAGTGEDYFTGKIVDNMTGRTAATLRVKRIDEDVYAEQMICLARMYHDALIGIETNYSREPMRVVTIKYDYRHVYMRERFDKTHEEMQKVPGFETTKKSKRSIIANLVSNLRENPTIEVDAETLKELLTFVKKEDGEQEAVEGSHDDLVMALAIAHHIGGQQDKDWMGLPDEPDPFYEKWFSRSSTRGSNVSYYEDDTPVAGGDGGNGKYISWEDL